MGVHALVNIPVIRFDHYEKGIEEYRAYFERFHQDFFNAPGILEFDTHLKNVVQLVFCSYDDNLLLKDDPMIWDKKLIKPTPIRPRRLPLKHNTTSGINRAYAIFRSAISKITESGHEKVLKAARALGGHVAYYGGDVNEAISMGQAEVQTIPTTKRYIETYIRDVMDGVRYGLKEPLKIEDNSPKQGHKQQVNNKPAQKLIKNRTE